MVYLHMPRDRVEYFNILSLQLQANHGIFYLYHELTHVFHIFMKYQLSFDETL